MTGDTRRAPSRRAALKSLAAAGAAAALAPASVLAQTPIVPPGPDDESAAQFNLIYDLIRRLAAPVTLDGQGPFRFVVDTGANTTVVSNEVADQVGLQRTGTVAINGVAGVGRAESALIRRLELGAVAQDRVRAALLPEAVLGAQGLLGVDVMKNRVVRIDFRGQQISFSRSRPKRSTPPSGSRVRREDQAALPPTAPLFPPDVVVVPARQRYGQLMIVDADLNGAPLAAFLDSGAQTTVGNLALRRIAGRANPSGAAAATEVTLQSVTGQTVSGELSRLPSLRLGGLRIGNMQVVYADLHAFRIWDLMDQPALLIGVDVLRHFDWVELDFGQKEVRFRAPR